MVSFLDKLVSLSFKLISLEHSVWLLVMKGELDASEGWQLVTVSREDQGGEGGNMSFRQQGEGRGGSKIKDSQGSFAVHSRK